MKKEIKFLKNKKLIYGCILALAIILYNFIWLNKTFTLSEGWTKVYLSLIENGKLPYRDYYYFLPPINLLTDFVFWKLSFGYFFIFRLFRLAERILIAELIYNLVSKKFSYYISAIICFIATVLASANVYDLVGDFNQTVQLLIIVLVYCVIGYYKSDDNKKRNVYGIAIGIVGGLMFCTKQTVVVASGIVFMLIVIFLAISKIEKNIWKLIGRIIIGAAIPISILLAYLVFTHSLTEFVNQVFLNAGSKGSLFDVLVKSQVNMIKARLSTFVALILIFVSKWINNNTDMEHRKKGIISKICIGIAVFLIGAYYGGTIWNALLADIHSGHIIILLLSIAIILTTKWKEKKGKIFFGLAGMASFVLLILNINGMTEKLYPNAVFDLMMEIVCVLHIYLLCWVVFCILEYIFKKKKCDVFQFILVGGALASGYTTSMATGVSSVSSITAFISIPAFFIIERSMFLETRSGENVNDNNEISLFSGKLIEIISLIIFTICLSQKLVCSYSWWGDTEASYWDKTEKSKVKELRGFRFSKEEIKRYDGITDLISRYTDEDSVIFSFPYAKVYNIFLDNYNMVGMAPVLFYDVCSDDIAINDAKLLRKNEPDIVIWLDIPSCMEVHEALFRGGEKLGQREIQKWFSEVKDTKYTLIGQVGDLFVYKLNDGKAVDYTYIERRTKINETAVYVEEDAEIHEFEGLGTESSPYLISSESDFIKFRDMVNEGYSFKDKYVAQTCDIDISDISNWTPIGVMNSGKLFEGTYDGNGKKIIGLNIKSEGQHVGLFGQLAGTVKNVNLLDCYVEGACIGGIASHGFSYSQIINCYVEGELKGERGGGICDNMGGSVINCVSKIKTNSDYVAGISGYYTNNVVNCYSNKGNKVSIDDGLKFNDESVNQLNKYIEKENKKLNYWGYIEGKLQVLENEIN